jgi:hypothetical protein
MRMVLWLVAALLCSMNINAQQISPKDYHAKIRTAEALAFNEQYNDALNVYTETLLNVSNTFTKDIYNALLIADHLNQRNSFHQLLALLSTKCIAQEVYFRDPLFAKNMKDEIVEKHIKDHSCIPAKGDSKLQKSIEKSREMVLDYSKIDQSPSQTYKISQKAMKELTQNWTLSTLPGEDELGVLNFKGEMLYDVVLNFYCKSGSTERRLKPVTTLLTNSVINGKTHPIKSAMWIDAQNDEFKTGSMGLARLGNMEALDINYSKETLDQINENRENLMLGTLHEEITRVRNSRKKTGVNLISY